MGARLVDEKLVVGNQIKLKFVWDGKDVGVHFKHFEYKSMLNGGEIFRCVLNDPQQTILGSEHGKYFDIARLGDSNTPQKVKFKFTWSTLEGGPKWSPEQEMSVVSVEPYAYNHDTTIEIVGVDNPSYMLVGGGASGEVFKGNVKGVIEQVVRKYGRGITPDVRSNTQDDKNNQWWMYRLDPQSFIMSLLEWSGKITKKKVEWFVYPDQTKLIIVQQSDMQSIPRSVYQYRGYAGDAKTHGDIQEHQLLADNILNMYRHHVVTNGLSAVSGAYYDKIVDKDRNIVHVGDKQTKNKLKAKVGDSRAFKRPSPDKKPPQDRVGWTTIPSVPEHNAGDLGIRYDKYVDGFARGYYLKLGNMLTRCRIRIHGHYIWAGSEGLGVDTIKIIMKSLVGGDAMNPYWLSDNWIVYGYHHTMAPGTWYTDLYCAKLDRDADAKAVGK